jgi:CRP-like cAMP-binding protein
MAKDRYLARLSEVPMFQACARRDLQTLGRRGDTVAIEAGDVLVREGTRGNEVYVVIDGKVEVSRDGIGIAELGPGEYFGELAVLDPGLRDATVTATTSGEVFVIGRREFHALVIEVPELAWKVMIGMARRLHEADGRPLR